MDDLPVTSHLDDDDNAESGRPPRPVRPTAMFAAAGVALTVALAFAGAQLWPFFILDLALAASFAWLGWTAYRHRSREE